MPYFTRRSYAETVAASTAAPRPEAGVVALAENVLAEAAAGGAVIGPFRLRRPVAPGAEGSTLLEIAPEARGGRMRLRLTPGTLRSGDELIEAARVALDPATLELGDGVPGRVRVTVAPPAGATPGIYRGMITAGGDARFAVAIEVEVEA